MTDIQLPALGESVTEGTITRWLKAVGDEVAVDEPIVEVSTDKVDTEVPSPVAGTLTEILADEDDTVPEGAWLQLTGTYTTHTIDWRAGEVRFTALHGHYSTPPDMSYQIAAYRVTGAAVPWQNEGLRVHINAWLVGGGAPYDGEEVEVVFTDADLPPPRACP